MILEKGETFNGCVVEQSTDTETGHVWIFSKMNRAVVISLPTDQYFDMIVKPHEKERAIDFMAECLNKAFKEGFTNKNVKVME